MDTIEMRTAELELEDDFEWVNAWAAAAKGEDRTASSQSAAALATMPVPAIPQIALAAEREPPLPLTAGAPGEIPFVPSAELMPSLLVTTGEDAPAHESTTSALPSTDQRAQDDDSDNVSVAASYETQVRPSDVVATEPLPIAGDPAQPVDDKEPVATADDVRAPAAAPLFALSQWMRRKRWGKAIRVGARKSQPAEHEIEPPEARVGAPPESVGLDIHPLPQRPDAELPFAPDHVALAPDQLERDIAEIEIVRDQLLAEAEGNAGRRLWAKQLQRARTADYVPILVGGALALTLLVVFGAAASFISLR